MEKRREERKNKRKLPFYLIFEQLFLDDKNSVLLVLTQIVTGMNQNIPLHNRGERAGQLSFLGGRISEVVYILEMLRSPCLGILYFLFWVKRSVYLSRPKAHRKGPRYAPQSSK